MKNVILGTALNYQIEHIKNFVLSFRKYNQEDDIILINVPSEVSFVLFCQKYNVKLIDFGHWNQLPINVVSSRFLRYENVLSEEFDYKHILLVDVRDVFFQGNPFENLPEDDYLYCFTEDPAISLDKEEHHNRMLSLLFNEDDLKSFENKKIICSGTILGTKNILLDWLAYFNKILFDVYTKKSEICQMMLLDQVIANVIYLHSPLKDKIVLKDNGDIVATIGHCITHPDHSGVLKTDENFIYLDNFIPKVVHQYDRSEELFKFISEKYSYVN